MQSGRKFQYSYHAKRKPVAFTTSKTMGPVGQAPIPAAEYWYFQCEDTYASHHHSAELKWSLRSA